MRKKIRITSTKFSRLTQKKIIKPTDPESNREKTVLSNGKGSLEALHGMYHVIIGGFPNAKSEIWASHMTQVPVAAFYPIFVSLVIGQSKQSLTLLVVPSQVSIILSDSGLI